MVEGAVVVGRSRLDFVGSGDAFELGFGTDEAVRVRRAQEEVRDTTTLTGTQKVKRTVKVYLTNLSDEKKLLEVSERVPVSEIEDLDITVTDAGGFRPGGKDGFLRREVELGPHATEELGIGYEIRAAAKVILPF